MINKHLDIIYLFRTIKSFEKTFEETLFYSHLHKIMKVLSKFHSYYNVYIV
jgi:hypothetical protein